MWISRKKWNSLRDELKSQKEIGDMAASLLNEYRDRNEYLRTMLDTCLEQLCTTEKWMRTRDEITGRFKKTGK